MGEVAAVAAGGRAGVSVERISLTHTRSAPGASLGRRTSPADVAGLPGLVPTRRRRRASGHRDLPQTHTSAHAPARRHVRAAGRARKGQRDPRALSLAVATAGFVVGCSQAHGSATSRCWCATTTIRPMGSGHHRQDGLGRPTDRRDERAACGALDGINEAGLAVSLTFGGGRAVADGLAIPLSWVPTRNLPDRATGSREASTAPIHAAQNLTILEPSGEHPPHRLPRTNRAAL